MRRKWPESGLVGVFKLAFNNGIIYPFAKAVPLSETEWTRRDRHYIWPTGGSLLSVLAPELLPLALRFNLLFLLSPR